MAKEDWEFDFEAVGDPHHEIADACRDRGLLDLYVNTKVDLFEERKDSIFRHPKGYFQPGVLALDSNGRILYRWRGVPSRKNMGGATERPTPTHVFEHVSQALDSAASGVKLPDAELDTNPKLDSRGIPWPIFVSLLVANGWFIKPETFTYKSGGPSAIKRVKRAAIRIPFFLGAWIVALIFLPTLWVGLALAGYTAWLTPRVLRINQQFQNVPGGG